MTARIPAIEATFPRITGAILVLLGGTVMAGWYLHVVPLVRVLPHYSPMVFNTALCFGLAGAALSTPFSDGPRYQLAITAIGGMLMAIASAVLAEHLLQVNLGIDWPGLHDWMRDTGPNPGRMSHGTAAGFMMGGAALMLAPRVQRLRGALTVRALTLGVGAIGVLGLAGYLVQAQLLFPEYFFSGIALHTAAGLLLLASGLWHAWTPFEWGRMSIFVEEDDRITFVGAMVLGVAAFAAGIGSFAILQERVQTLVGESVAAALRHRNEMFQDLIELRETSARIAATRPAVIRNLQVIRDGSDDASNLANVSAVVASFLNEGFGAIAYHDSNGRVVASGGVFAQEPALVVMLATPDKGELLWDNGFLLRHRLPMRDATGTVGMVHTEQRMAVLTRLAQNMRMGATGDMGVCTRRGEQLHCFPQRLNPRSFSTPLVNIAGDSLPMVRALQGETGLVITRDYRAQNVMAAFGPVGGLGLGMVVKVDAAEIFQPIREQLQIALGLLLLLVAGGTWLLRARVRPLATKLVYAETQARVQGRRLEEKNAELERASQAKDRFLATMSHELRTPLNAIIGFTGTLLMRLPGPLTPDQETQLQTVSMSAKHLLALINDLLDLAKVDAGKLDLHLEPVAVRGVLEQVTATLRPQAEAKDLNFDVALPPADLVVLTDRRALSQIVLNLVNNAIKFTERGSVRLAVRHVVAPGGDGVEISVEDTGIGIRPEDQAKVFGAFTQMDASTVRRNEGTGLGLHLSRKLAELLNGTIEFQSTYGKGSTFKLILPEG